MSSELGDSIKLMSTAIKAIRADAAEKNRSAGHIECPKCKGKLGYSIARSNGHIWGRCETPDCLAWMM